MEKAKKKYTGFDIFLVVFLGIISITCILPFVNLLAVSFSGSSAVAAGNVGLIPKDFTLASYEYVISGGKFLRALWVSVQRLVLGVGVNLILMILTAYPLSKTTSEFKGRNYYMLFFVITMLIGGGMIPTYLVVSGLGLRDSIWSLILPTALPVSNMIILMNFIRNLPKEMEEAAFVDGATPFQTLIFVLLPVLKPALATVGLFSAIGHWNDWFTGSIYMTNPDNYPLQTYLQTLLQNFDRLLQSTSGVEIQALLSQMNARTGRAAQLFLGALPIMIIYPFLQKYFTDGLVIGSVKG